MVFFGCDSVGLHLVSKSYALLTGVISGMSTRGYEARSSQNAQQKLN